MPKNTRHQSPDISCDMPIKITAIRKDPADLALLAKVAIQIADSLSMEELKKLIAEAKSENSEDKDKVA